MDDQVFNCERCGYSTNIKCNLIEHLKRKKECDPVVSNVARDVLLARLKPPPKTGVHKCTNCDKAFNHASSMYRHRRSCQGDAGSTQSSSSATNIQIINNNTTNNITNNIEIHNHLVLIPFGQELDGLDYLFQGRYKQIMAKCIAEPSKGVQHIIRMVHFNKDRPEYQNVCIPNISRSHAMCYDGANWVMKDKDAVLEKLVDASATVMYTFVNEYEAELPRHALESYERFDEKRDYDDPTLLGALRKDAERTIINHQDDVGVREKVRQSRRRERPGTMAGAADNPLLDGL